MKKRESKIVKMESEKLEELFAESFKKIMDTNKEKISVDEFECAAEKDLASDVVKIKVTVYGLAGTTPKRMIHDKKNGGVIAKCLKTVNVEDIVFKLEDSFDLNTNDYVLMFSN